jgi:hypothetical protein
MMLAAASTLVFDGSSTTIPIPPNGREHRCVGDLCLSASSRAQLILVVSIWNDTKQAGARCYEARALTHVESLT